MEKGKKVEENMGRKKKRWRTTGRGKQICFMLTIFFPNSVLMDC